MTVSLDSETDALIQRQIDNGPYQTAEEVVKAALRLLEEHERKLAYLRKIVADAEEQFERGEFVEWTPALREEIPREAIALARQGHTPNPDVVP